MIIGKSITALGGGGLKPEITVTAKAGALLNLHFKDSSIILQSHQLGTSETTHTFVVNVSETTYVVDDVTNGGSIEVLVDAVAQYSVNVSYILYLYKDGVEYESITGSWINGNGGFGYGTETFVKNDTDLYLCAEGRKGYSARVWALLNKPLNLKNYKTVFVELKSAEARAHLSSSRYYSYGGIIIKSEQDENYTELYCIAGETLYVTVESGIKSIDVSSYSGNVNIGLYVYAGSGEDSYCKMNVSKIWLE